MAAVVTAPPGRDTRPCRGRDGRCKTLRRKLESSNRSRAATRAAIGSASKLIASLASPQEVSPAAPVGEPTIVSIRLEVRLAHRSRCLTQPARTDPRPRVDARQRLRRHPAEIRTSTLFVSRTSRLRPSSRATLFGVGSVTTDVCAQKITAGRAARESISSGMVGLCSTFLLATSCRECGCGWQTRRSGARTRSSVLRRSAAKVLALSLKRAARFPKRQ